MSTPSNGVLKNGAAKRAFQQAGLHVPAEPLVMPDAAPVEAPSPFRTIHDPQPTEPPLTRERFVMPAVLPAEEFRASAMHSLMLVGAGLFAGYLIAVLTIYFKLP